MKNYFKLFISSLVLLSCIREPLVVPEPISEGITLEQYLANLTNPSKGLECGNVVDYIPASGSILDNGRVDRQDFIFWSFAWPKNKDASHYELYVIGEKATIPVINRYVYMNCYADYSEGAYITNYNRLNWSWKVRPIVNGVPGEWSEVIYFDVEPLDTDPPSGG